MNCKNKDLQSFVNWLQSASEYMFRNVVTARVNISGGRQSDTFAMGFLSFVPTHIIGLPAGPKGPERNVPDYLQGNLVNTNEGLGTTRMVIEMGEPSIGIYLLNVHNNQIETIKMKAAPCEISGNTLRIMTEGDDGLSYEIKLSTRKALAVSHQMNQ